MSFFAVATSCEWLVSEFYKILVCLGKHPTNDYRQQPSSLSISCAVMYASLWSSVVSGSHMSNTKIVSFQKMFTECSGLPTTPSAPLRPLSLFLRHETHTESIYCSFRSVYALRTYDVLSIFDFRRQKKINKTTAGPAIVAIRMYFHTIQNGWRALNYESDARNERLKIYHRITLADCHTNSEHPRNGEDFWLLHGSHSQLMMTE